MRYFPYAAYCYIKAVREYRKHENEELYKSVMNVIVRANNEKFEETKNMCEALRELFKDELEEGITKARLEGMNEGISQGLSLGVSQGLNQGIQSMIETCKSLGASKDVVFNLVM